MKRFALLACLTFAGCIINSGDDASGVHNVVTWSLEALATQTPQPCPVGYDTAAVYSQPIDDNEQDDGDPIIDLFNCSDGSGETSTLTDSGYAEYVVIATDDNSIMYGQSVPVFVQEANDMMEVDTPPIYTDAGHFELTWTLTAASNGATLTCADDPDVYSIDVAVTDNMGTTTMQPPLGCADQVGYTAGILAGTYTIAVTANDATGAPLGAAATIQATIVVTATMGSPIVDLGTIVIPIGNK